MTSSTFIKLIKNLKTNINDNSCKLNKMKFCDCGEETRTTNNQSIKGATHVRVVVG